MLLTVCVWVCPSLFMHDVCSNLLICHRSKVITRLCSSYLPAALNSMTGPNQFVHPHTHPFSHKCTLFFSVSHARWLPWSPCQHRTYLLSFITAESSFSIFFIYLFLHSLPYLPAHISHPPIISSLSSAAHPSSPILSVNPLSSILTQLYHCDGQLEFPPVLLLEGKE